MINCILVLLSPFLSLTFHVVPDGTYSRGPLFIFMILAGRIYFFALFLSAVRELIRKNGLKYEAKNVLGFMIPAMLSGVLQTLTSNMPAMDIGILRQFSFCISICQKPRSIMMP